MIKTLKLIDINSSTLWILVPKNTKLPAIDLAINTVAVFFVYKLCVKICTNNTEDARY